MINNFKATGRIRQENDVTFQNTGLKYLNSAPEIFPYNGIFTVQTSASYSLVVQDCSHTY